MKLARLAFSPDLQYANRVLWWSLGLVALPLVLFIGWTVLQSPSRFDQLTPVTQVDVWYEDVGTIPFRQPELELLSRKAPPWQEMDWTPATLPLFKPLGASIDLPPDAPKKRVWLCIKLPKAHERDDHGRLGLLGTRVQGGPWAAWADGRLIQANLADWRIQWNVPIKLTVPLDTDRIYLSVPYAQAQGFSVGSMWVGHIDAVESAWEERNLLHGTLPKAMELVAIMLTVISAHLAWLRRGEPAYAILAVSGIVLMAVSVQWTFDVTGQDTLTVWFGSAVDSAIAWQVVLVAIFAFAVEGFELPLIRIGLVAYAAISTILTLPVWDWQKNALIAQQYAAMGSYVLVIGVFSWRMLKRPTRTAAVLLLAMLTQITLGFHTLENLTNQTNPDSFYSFPLSSLLMYMAFTYVLARRTSLAMDATERHEATLLQQLQEQERRLDVQHKALQKLEVQRQLSEQHNTIMQDLHDRLGSNLTSALLQARSGQLSPGETVLLLQELTDELRHIASSNKDGPRTLNEVLVDLRRRVEHRLAHGGIQLEWEVAPDLPMLGDSGTSQHLHALLSEVIANSIKHAQPQRIRVAAEASSLRVCIAIEDNGIGFDPDTVETGRGLPGLRNRAKAMGARLHIASTRGHGTKVEIELPRTPTPNPTMDPKA